MVDRDRAWRALDHAREFHRRLKTYYHRLSLAQTTPRVRLLLDYLSNHQADLERSVATYEKEAPASVVDSWVECDFTSCQLALREEAEMDKAMTVEQVIDLADKADACLQATYRRLIAEGKEPDACTFFSHLLAFELNEKKTVTRNAQQILDL